MSDTTVHNNLSDPQTSGISPLIWPLIVGITAFVLLAFTVARQLENIPLSLASQAQKTALAADASDINISVNGRDLSLSGTIGPDTDRNQLVQQLASIDGMRVVLDDMTEFDPGKQARLEQLGFRQQLEHIDLSKVVFEAGSAELATSSEDALEQLVQLLQANPRLRIRVIGHTDNTGRAEVNLRISGERAESVAAYLESRSVTPTQIIARGYGATQPIADNNSEAGRARNRRIEVSYVD